MYIWVWIIHDSVWCGWSFWRKYVITGFLLISFSFFAPFSSPCANLWFSSITFNLVSRYVEEVWRREQIIDVHRFPLKFNLNLISYSPPSEHYPGHSRAKLKHHLRFGRRDWISSSCHWTAHTYAVYTIHYLSNNLFSAEKKVSKEEKKCLFDKKNK